MASLEDGVLDKVVFELREGHRRCEIVAVRRERRDWLASDTFGPYLWHLGDQVKEQFMSGSSTIVLDPCLEKRHQSGYDLPWFTKATVLRFIRFVNMPCTLEDICVMADRMRALEDLLTTNDLLFVLGHVPLLVAEDLGELLPCLLSAQDSSLAGSMSMVAGRGGLLNSTSVELKKALGEQKAVLIVDLVQAVTRAVASGFSLNIVPDLEAFAEFFDAKQLRSLCRKYMANCCRRGMFYWVMRSCCVMEAVSDPPFSRATLQKMVCVHPTVEFPEEASAEESSTDKSMVPAEANKGYTAAKYFAAEGDAEFHKTDQQQASPSVSHGHARPAISLDSPILYSASPALSPDSTLPERSDWLLTPHPKPSPSLQSLGNALMVKEDSRIFAPSARMHTLDSSQGQQPTFSSLPLASSSSVTWQDVGSSNMSTGMELFIYGSFTRDSSTEPEVDDMEPTGRSEGTRSNMEQGSFVGRKKAISDDAGRKKPRKGAPRSESLRSSSDLYRERRKRRLQQKQEQGPSLDGVQLEEMAQSLERQRTELLATKPTPAWIRYNAHHSTSSARLSYREMRNSVDIEDRTSDHTQGSATSPDHMSPQLADVQSANKEAENMNPEARRVQNLLSQFETLVESAPCPVAHAPRPWIQGDSASRTVDMSQADVHHERPVESSSTASLPSTLSSPPTRISHPSLTHISPVPYETHSSILSSEGPAASFADSLSSKEVDLQHGSGGLPASLAASQSAVHGARLHATAPESSCERMERPSPSGVGPAPDALCALSCAEQDTSCNYLHSNQLSSLNRSITPQGFCEANISGNQREDRGSDCLSINVVSISGDSSAVGGGPCLDLQPPEQAADDIPSAEMQNTERPRLSPSGAGEIEQDPEATRRDLQQATVAAHSEMQNAQLPDLSPSGRRGSGAGEGEAVNGVPSAEAHNAETPGLSQRQAGGREQDLEATGIDLQQTTVVVFSDMQNARMPDFCQTGTGEGEASDGVPSGEVLNAETPRLSQSKAVIGEQDSEATEPADLSPRAAGEREQDLEARVDFKQAAAEVPSAERQNGETPGLSQSGARGAEQDSEAAEADCKQAAAEPLLGEAQVAQTPNLSQNGAEGGEGDSDALEMDINQAAGVSSAEMQIGQTPGSSQSKAAGKEQGSDFNFSLANCPHSSEGEGRGCMALLTLSESVASGRQSLDAAPKAKLSAKGRRPFPSFDDWVVDRASLFVGDKLPGAGLLSTRTSRVDGAFRTKAPLNSLLLDLHGSASAQETSALELPLLAAPDATPRHSSLPEQPVGEAAERSPLESIREAAPAGPSLMSATAPPRGVQPISRSSDPVSQSESASSPADTSLLLEAPAAQGEKRTPSLTGQGQGDLSVPAGPDSPVDNLCSLATAQAPANPSLPTIPTAAPAGEINAEVGGEISAVVAGLEEVRPASPRKKVGSAFLHSWSVKRTTKGASSPSRAPEKTGLMNTASTRVTEKEKASKLDDETRGGSKLRRFFEGFRRKSGSKSHSSGEERGALGVSAKKSQTTQPVPATKVASMRLGTMVVVSGNSPAAREIGVLERMEEGNESPEIVAEASLLRKGSSWQSKSATTASVRTSPGDDMTIRKPEKLKAPWEEALWKAWEDDRQRDQEIAVANDSKEPWEQALRNAWEEELSSAKTPISTGHSMSFTAPSTRSSSLGHHKSLTFSHRDNRRGELLSEDELLKLAGPSARITTGKAPRPSRRSLIPAPPPDFKLREEHLERGRSKLRQPKWSFLATLWGSNRLV